MNREPPLEYRFKKGQSGNPKGRPKKVDKEKEFFDVAMAVMQITYKALNCDECAVKKMKSIKKLLK